MPNYENGKIYKLINSINDKIYVGSTCKKYLSDRMGGHRGDARKGRTSLVYEEMRRVGIENFKIKLIENYPCNSRIDLEKREYHIMRRYIRQEFKLLNSTVEFGKMSMDVKKKMSGSLNYRFRRGSLHKVAGKCPVWVFQWKEGGKQCSKSFSINKYGEKRAKRLAEKVQNEIYPLKTSK